MFKSALLSQATAKNIKMDATAQEELFHMLLPCQNVVPTLSKMHPDTQ